MSNFEPVLSSVSGDVQAAIDAGTAMADPYQLGPDGRFWSSVIPEGGELVVTDLEELRDKYRDQPRRKTGKVTVHDADSFVRYYAKHGVPESEIFADLPTSKIVAVINSHGPAGERADVAPLGEAGWGDHRVTLALQHTPTWLVWKKHDRRMMPQLDFANHIEDQVAAILAAPGMPSGADMLEVAQSLSVNRKVSFESSQKLSNGERALHYREDDTASTSSKKGSVAIPERFLVALQPYEGGDTYQVPARLRYSIADGVLLLGYYLDRPDEVLRNAFNDVRLAVQEGTGATALAGTPAG